MNWRAIDHFPKVEKKEWQARAGLWNRSVTGQEAVEVALKGWNPLSSLLIGTPDSSNLLPPVLVQSLQEKIINSFLRRCQSSLLIALFFICACLVLAHLHAGPNMLTAAHILIGIEAFLAAEYWLVFRHKDAVIERSLYSFWVRKTAWIDFFLWAGVMLTAGLLQLLAQWFHGGLQPTVDRYGIVFSALTSRESWRLLSGPFLHNDFPHWATNTLFLIFVGMVAGRISRANAAAVFVIGSLVGAVATWIYIPSQDDAYLGVSAGVMAILGFSGGVAWRDKQNFPKALGFTLITFGLLNVYLSWIYSPNAANEAHVAGLMLGVVWGLLFQQAQIRQSFRLAAAKPLNDGPLIFGAATSVRE